MQQEQINVAIDELWQLTQNPKRPASEIINEYTRQRRYIGSKDRKIITESVWARWRAMPYPEWLAKKINNFDDELTAMQTKQAPTVLRVNRNREQVKALLEKEGIETQITRLSALGLVLSKRTNFSSIESGQRNETNIIFYYANLLHKKSRRCRSYSAPPASAIRKNNIIS